MKTLIIKSLLTSLWQREVIYPSLEKRGVGRFFNNDALLMNSLVTCEKEDSILHVSTLSGMTLIYRVKKLKLLLVFLQCLTFIFLSGCGGNHTLNNQHMDLPQTKDSQSEKVRALMLQTAMMKNVDPDADYIIGSDDALDIEVFEVEELKKTVRVSSQGYISLSLIGQIKAKGLTPLQLEQEIARKLDTYLNAPLVSVYVKEYKAQRIGVIGAVDKPQVYIITGQRYLLDMFSMAGGLPKGGGNKEFVFE